MHKLWSEKADYVTNNKLLHAAALVWAQVLFALVVSYRGSIEPIWFMAAFWLVGAALFFTWPSQAMVFCQWLFGAILAIAFVDNTFRERGALALMFVLGCGASLLLYGLVEGYEIAFTQLGSKEKDRFDQKTQDLLGDMKRFRHLFYESREWLVILLVIALTLSSDFHNVHLFPDFNLSKRWQTVSFNVLFTTLMAVWVAQSPCKGLASENPVWFLRSCRWLWPPLKLFGLVLESVQAFAPAATIKTGLARWLPGFRSVPELLPSQEALFHTLLKRYGYAVYMLKDAIAVSPDGTAMLTQTAMFYVVSGGRSQFARWFSFDEAILSRSNGDPEITCQIETFQVENFGDEVGPKLHRELESIFAGDGDAAKRISLGIRAEIRYLTTELGQENRNKASVIINSPRPLPEGLPSNHAVAIRVVTEIVTLPNAFRTPSNAKVSDCYYLTLSAPCRQCSIVIRMEDGRAEKQYANLRKAAFLGEAPPSTSPTPHPLEQERVTARLGDDNKSISFVAEIPIPGVRYQIDWDVWP